eukprot:7403274-Pyramimonas_sp.AAC.1
MIAIFQTPHTYTHFSTFGCIPSFSPGVWNFMRVCIVVWRGAFPAMRLVADHTGLVNTVGAVAGRGR